MGAREDHRWRAKRKRVLGAAGTILAAVSLISRQATSSIVSEAPRQRGAYGEARVPDRFGGRSRDDRSKLRPRAAGGEPARGLRAPSRSAGGAHRGSQGRQGLSDRA